MKEISFALIFFSSFTFSSESFFEVSLTDRSEDIFCVSNDWIEVNQRVNQLTSILVNNNASLGTNYVIEKKAYEGVCLKLKKIPSSYQSLVSEIIIIIENQVSEQNEPLLLEEKSNKPDSEKYNTDMKTVLKTSGVLAGVQVLNMVALLYLVPRSLTRWDDPDLFANIPTTLKDSFTKPPVWDKDHWSANYVSHPYVGSVYYNALRSQDYSPLNSLLFATFQSTFWEYFIESIFERPSIQDLIITPITGALIGEGSHYLTHKMSRNGFNTLEKVVVTLINPAYAVTNGFKKKNKKPVLFY